MEVYYLHFNIYQTLGDSPKNLNYFYGPCPKHLNLHDCLFIALIVLRRHKTFYELSILFRTTIKDISNIFFTWIKLLSLQSQQILIWTSPKLISYYSPNDFRDKYPKVRAIVDGTEIPIQKPKYPRAQQSTLSSYKNRNTAKVLVGATPGGLLSFVTESYGGSVSDRQLTERSKLAEKCEKGDVILAGKGFDVQDILAPYEIVLNVPHFFKKGNRLTEGLLNCNKKIGFKRVHIEQINSSS